MRPKYRNPIATRTFEMLISSGIVYLITPMLQKTLAPLQAQINAAAVNDGQIPVSNGLSDQANALVTLLPTDQPTKSKFLIDESPTIAVVDNPTPH